MSTARLAFAALIGFAPLPARADFFTVTALPKPEGGQQATPTAISDDGRVVGYQAVPYGYRAVAWQDGTVGVLESDGMHHYSYASSVNNSGQIVGSASGGGYDATAVVWGGGSIGWLNDLADSQVSDGFHTFAIDVNNSGHIVGQANDPQGRTRAVEWTYDTVTELERFGAGYQESAQAINDAGQSVGTAFDGDGRSTAVTWTGGAISALAPADPSWTYGYAIDINESGTIVGRAGLDRNHPQAFIYQNGVMTVIGGEHSFALGIDDAGRVLGGLGGSPSGSPLFLWDEEFGKRDLNGMIASSGWDIWGQFGAAINARGDIVAYGYHPEYGESALLLTANDAPTVPAPPALVLALTGFASAVGFRRR